MADILEVTILGRVGQEPELRQGPNTQVCNLRIATRDRQGETVWSNAVLFGRDAENAVQYLTKGSKVLIRGARPALVEWSDAQGNPRTRLEYLGGTVYFL